MGSRTARDSFASEVAEHYNQVEQKKLAERKHSEIIDLRKFNNAMKSWMHHLVIDLPHQLEEREPLRILDLGCGKGGDLPKFVRIDKVGSVVGVDIAGVSIEQCKDRFKHLRFPPGRKLKGDFFVADLTRDIIREEIKKLGIENFHLASAQFNLHYSFESFEQAVRYILNASENLTFGGYFYGTYPDGPKLLKLARNSETPGQYKVGDILKVEFTPESLTNPRPFGTRYHFFLKEVVNCPEFLVHPKVLEKLLLHLGFIKIFDRSFEETILKAKEGEKKDIFETTFEAHDAFRIKDGHATLDEFTWQSASIYRCFCYRKMTKN